MEKENEVYLSGSILDVKPIEVHSKIVEIQDLLDYIHIDVMDGLFVPEKTDGINMFKNSLKFENKPLDVHLMVDDPLSVISNYDGADIITFHVENIINDKTMTIDMDKFNEISKTIKGMGAKVGVALKPNTTESLLRMVMPKVDLILVMTVEPGYGGQKLIQHTLNKVENVRKMGYKGLVEVDGGITIENVEEAVKRGANMIVAGTALFKAYNLREAAMALKG
ncbi:MAG: ribulose-phosphate 3-epimerase [Clostridia bacterium]|nr:ribulose-phosphate 3-epimerase [Clostridia bacterium]